MYYYICTTLSYLLTSLTKRPKEYLRFDSKIICFYKGHCGHDHMVVGFTTTYAISAYHH